MDGVSATTAQLSSDVQIAVALKARSAAKAQAAALIALIEGAAELAKSVQPDAGLEIDVSA